MSEVYQASETTPPPIEAGASASADNPGSYPDVAPDDNFIGYSDSDIDAILAAEDQLPEPCTRQEATAATWDDSPDDSADSSLATEYDGDVAALLAEEQQLPEPRTRQEVAAATWDDTTQLDDDSGSFSGDPATEYDGDVATLLAAEDRLPEPRTRQEAAAATWDDASTSQDDRLDTSTSPSQPDTQPQDADQAITTLDLTEEAPKSLTSQGAAENDGGTQDRRAASAGRSEDGSPRTETRTGHQAPSEAEPDSAALSENVSETTTGTDGGKTTEARQDQDQHAPSPPDEPGAEDQARLHQLYQDYLKEQRSGWDEGTNVVGDKPSRSPGDTSNLPPTGGKLLETEDDDSSSHLEKLRQKIYEEAEDVSDITDEYGGTLGQLFEHPPTEIHTEVPTAPHYMPSYQEHGVDGGHLATAGLVVGVLGFELFRAINNKVRAWRAR